MPTTPGTGKTNPFGDGAGAPGAGQTGGMGNNFTKNPGGARPTRKGGGQPPTYGASRPATKSIAQADINPNEVPEGGRHLLADNVPLSGDQNEGPSGGTSGEDVGTTAGTRGTGAAHKPFKLGGSGY